MATHIYAGRVSSILLFVLYCVLPLATAAFIGANNITSLAPFSEIAKRQMDPGSSCSDEGQWNCMGTSWQRCAAGRWTKVVECAPGTRCTPNGLTDDMNVDNATDSSDSDSGSSSSSPGPNGGRPSSGKTETTTSTSTSTCTCTCTTPNSTTNTPTPRSTTCDTPHPTGVPSTETETTIASTPTAGSPGGYAGWRIWSPVGLVVAVMAA